MAEIHFILQGKGGVGKTMLASMLLQAFMARGKRCLGIDTDPVNSSLAAFESLPVKQISILENDSESANIDIRKFDMLLEELVNAPADDVIVVDNGASSFVALSTYIRENDLLATLRDAGHNVIFHSIVVGGQGLNDTCKNLQTLLKKFQEPNLLVVWENFFLGAIERQVNGETRRLENFTVIREHQEQIRAIIRLPVVNQNLAGRDLQELLSRSLTFDEGMAQSCIAVRSRLQRYWKELIRNMDEAGILPPACHGTEPYAGEYHE